MLLLSLSFGLRISETLSLKWKDIDFFKKTLRIQRGIVKQIVDDVKSSNSASVVAIADEMFVAIMQWKQTTEFGDPEDWDVRVSREVGRAATELHVRLVHARGAGQKGRHSTRELAYLSPHVSHVARFSRDASWRSA